MLDSAYSSDDIVNSQIPMEAEAHDVSYWEFVSEKTRGWVDSVGRFFPASIAESALIFRLFTSRAAYKAYQFAVVLVNLGLLGWLVWRLGRDRWLAALSVLLVTACLQFRFFHDAVLQFNGQQQIVLGCVLGALLLTHAAVVRRRWWLLVPTVVLWALALTTYETAFLAVPAFGAVIWHAGSTPRWRRAAVAAAVVPVVAFGAVMIYFRSQVEVTHGAYTTDLSPSKVVPTFVEQAAASLPLTYAAFNVPPRPPDTPDQVEPVSGALDVRLPFDPLVGLLTGGAVAVCALRVGRPDRRTALTLVIVGATLWLPPALLMATTPRWQEQLHLGLGYITAYAGAFGVAVLGAVALSLVLPRLAEGSVPRIAAVTVLAVSTAFATQATADNNDRVVHMFSGSRVMQETFQHAVERGIFDPVADGAVLASPPVGWVTDSFIAWYGGPRVRVVADSADADWVLEHGWQLARAGRPEPPPASAHAWVQVSKASGTRVRLYLEDPAVDDHRWQISVGDTPVAPAEVRVVREGDGWLMVELRISTSPGPIPLVTVKLV